jgi:hypothetical protein
MWRRVFAVVFALSVSVCGALAPSAAAKVRVSVRPAIGKPRTKFVIGFRAPSTTGNFSTVHSHYQVSVSARKGKRCASSSSIAAGPTRRGQQVRMMLVPKGSRRVWCAGRFRGTITEISKISCRRLTAIVCPAIEIAPIPIAHFSFRVRKAARGSSGSASSGPSFAGLQSATMCTALPKPLAQQRLLPTILPEQRVIQLAWIPATDPATASSKIVYDIYYSPTSGGENYSTPNWTTAPGATGFTVDLPGIGPAYFVVRARDQAGREDHNTVQRLAVNTCRVPLPAAPAR